MPASKESGYRRIIEHVFFHSQSKSPAGSTVLPFARPEIADAALALGIKVPKNLGDVVSTFRFRKPLPKAILDTQPDKKEWLIELNGRSLYKFVLADATPIVPNPALMTIDIPDATPEIIGMYAQGDEQALLARVRYNRLIDTFLRVTAYSLQSHLRTQVSGIGQIEIDEVYVALDREGEHYVVPVQAKGGRDQLSVVQTKQDLAWAELRFPELKCRAVSAQFVGNEKIAMFELALQDGSVRIVQERHYQLTSRAR